MRNDNLNRSDLNRDNLGSTEPVRRGIGGMTIGILAVLAVLALLWAWAPWSGPRTANAPGTTVGSSTNRPAAPAPAAPVPTAPAPAAPSK
jgi:hypothetical protein